jgi:SynChlorMet cassette radical SAM/SPASM protein ScmF
MSSQAERIADISPRPQAGVGLDLPDGVPPLNTLYLYIAGSCNLACRHCWIAPNFVPGGSGGQFIKLEHVRKVIEQALPLGLHAVKLTGGEPLLHPQIRQIITLAAGAGLDITIETNGTLVDAGLAAFLKASGQVSFISVSLDGATPATHEALRMVPGSFQKTIDGACNLVAVGYRPQIICTLHQGNVQELAQVVALAQDLGCGSVKFNHVQSNGRGKNMAKNEGLSVPALIELYHYVEEELVPSSKIPIFFDIPFAFKPLRTLLNGNLSRCGILNILGLLSGGELSMCGIGVTVAELVYGNIECDQLADIWCKAERLKELRKLIPGQLKGVCGNCLHRDFCLGECVASNYNITGSLNESYYFCAQAEQSELFPQSRRRSCL